MKTTYWTVTNLNKVSSLARKIRNNENSGYNEVIVRGNCIILQGDSRPWAVLNGHMTNNTDVAPFSCLKDAKTHLGN